MIFNAIVLPYMDPILLELGNFKLHWYALAYIIGIFYAWFYGIKVCRDPEFWLPPPPIPALVQIPPESLLLVSSVSFILGGRIGYVVFYNPSFFLEHPSKIFAIWMGGMSFHGALIGLILGCLLFCHYKKLPFSTLMDLVGTVAPVGMTLGRIGNFINAEILGTPSNLPWAVVFPGDGIARHPVQIYESILEGFIPFVVVHLVVKRYKALSWPFLISGCYLSYYGAVRIFAEFFRAPPIQEQEIGYLLGFHSTGVLLSFPLIPFGIFLILRSFYLGPRLKWDPR